MRSETNLIEITVRGGIGRGKSEVLEIISNALKDFYPEGFVVGETCEGAIEEAKTTRQTAKGSSTVFMLYERTPSQ